ncbi:MAG: hypothetical protein LAT65_00885 [Saccharospirillum sp.]|nr:hypothetical protein [Saccharospirillum sp.]
MKELTISHLDPQDHLVSPYEFFDWTEQSPVLALLKDFRIHQPHKVRSNASAIDVARQMAMEGVDCKLVADKTGELVGLLSEDRLCEQRFLITQALLGVGRLELTASDMMQPRAEIPVVDYEALKNIQIADMLNTLRESGETYCLVLDREQHQIRGLISVSDLAGRLHQTLTVKPKVSIAQAVAS